MQNNNLNLIINKSDFNAFRCNTVHISSNYDFDLVNVPDNLLTPHDFLGYVETNLTDNNLIKDIILEKSRKIHVIHNIHKLIYKNEDTSSSENDDTYPFFTYELSQYLTDRSHNDHLYHIDNLNDISLVKKFLKERIYRYFGRKIVQFYMGYAIKNIIRYENKKIQEEENSAIEEIEESTGLSKKAQKKQRKKLNRSKKKLSITQERKFIFTEASFTEKYLPFGLNRGSITDFEKKCNAEKKINFKTFLNNRLSRESFTYVNEYLRNYQQRYKELVENKDSVRAKTLNFIEQLQDYEAQCALYLYYLTELDSFNKSNPYAKYLDSEEELVINYKQQTENPDMISVEITIKPIKYIYIDCNLEQSQISLEHINRFIAFMNQMENYYFTRLELVYLHILSKKQAYSNHVKVLKEENDE